MTTAPSAAPSTIEIRLNGQPKRVSEATTIASLLQELGKDPRTVAIERNGEIVRRARFDETGLAAGDVLELVQFVQGG
jgi:thiamine biosynthesis protein ThiS